MLGLRSFVHQRLSAAAEEILGEVEKIIKLALNDAAVRDATESPHINGAVKREDVLQETQPLRQEQSEVPGSCHTSTHTENSDGTYCLVQIDFKIKEEQEELRDDSRTPEFVSPEAVKTESDQPETHMINELPPVSSDDSVASSENSDSDEEWVHSKGMKVLHRQNGNKKQKGQAALTDGFLSAKSQKDHSVCPVCGKSFQYIRSFIKHLKTHNRTSESTKKLLSELQSARNKRLVCDVCGKTFTNAGCLHVHSKIHTGIKDFKCQDCGKSFVRKEHLIVHMRIHSGERPYRCDVCGRAFTQSQNLKTHRLTHTGKRLYQCGTCGKFFYTHGQLRNHMKRFSRENPFSCDICGKIFCQRGQMIQHQGTHAGGSTK